MADVPELGREVTSGEEVLLQAASWDLIRMAYIYTNFAGHDPPCRPTPSSSEHARSPLRPVEGGDGAAAGAL